MAYDEWDQWDQLKDAAADDLYADDPRNDPGYDLFDRPDEADEDDLVELDDEYDGDDPEEHKLSTRKSRRDRSRSDS